jgi:hypothetical protein
MNTNTSIFGKDEQFLKGAALDRPINLEEEDSTLISLTERINRKA